MSKIPRKPNGICRIITGKEGRGPKDPPKQFEFGLVERQRGGKWEPHPDFPGERDAGSSEFHIELQSNNLEVIWQSHLGIYDGKRPFCMRAHRRDDQPGAAVRRTKAGDYKLIECDPSQCPLHQEHINKDSKRQYIDNEYQRLYPYAKLRGLDCFSYGFLTFALLTKGGEYAHSEAEFCYFQTRSEMNNSRFKDVLRRLWVLTKGQLRGLRLKLCYEPFESRWGRLTNAWMLRVPDDVDFGTQKEMAALRAGSPAPALPSSSELAEMGEERNLTGWTSAVMDIEEQDQLDALEGMKVNAEYIDIDTVSLIARDPAVIDITKRLKMNYDQRVQLDLAFEDVYWAVEWLQQRAQKKGIPVDDILRKYGYESFLITEHGSTVSADDVETSADNDGDDSEVLENQRKKGAFSLKNQEIEVIDHDPQPVDEEPANDLFKGGK